ncbi:MAG: type II toxin-antitoxin system HicB family antitoxin [Deltaproteobacteria bacterium]|nr:type II toxin-antitoxin system HicB family antitoxin [Deltaproteobacteria bacterium]
MRKVECLVLIEEDEDGVLVASVPSLRGCHTQAKNMDQLLKRIKEAIRLCLKVERKAPKPLKFIGLQEMKVAC